MPNLAASPFSLTDCVSDRAEEMLSPSPAPGIDHGIKRGESAGFHRGLPDGVARGLADAHAREEARGGHHAAERWQMGIDAIDACLPPAGMSRAGLHEIEPLAAPELPALTGFAFALLSRLRPTHPIVWCVTAEQVGEHGHLYAHGLQRYGISPSQIVFAKVNHPLHLHFALEEAIRTSGVAAVIGEGRRPDFTGSRRLSLLARAHGCPCLLLNPQPENGRGSAALTRWQIAPSQGVEDPHDPFGPGMPTWRVALPRARGGKSMPEMQEAERANRSFMERTGKTNPYPWSISWDDQTLSFHPASAFRDGSLPRRPQTAGHAAQTLVGRRSAAG